MDNRDQENGEPSLDHEPLSLGISLSNEKEKAGALETQSSIHSSETVHRGEEEAPPLPPLSNASSISSQPVKVPRSARRGLFGRFTILAEVEEPKHYGRRTKWFITFIVALAAAAAPMGSAIFFRTFFQKVWTSIV